MVMVFKTTVQNQEHIGQLRALLDQLVLPAGQWNFDLEDCDRILRVRHAGLSEQQLIDLLSSSGFACEALQD